MSAGRKILVVEDESVIAMMLRMILAQHGYSVVGPYGHLKQAMAALERDAVDLALLDVQLGSEFVYPLAAQLRRRGTPFIFLTGHDALENPDQFAGCVQVRKPFRAEALLAAIADQLARPAAARQGGSETARPRVGG